MANIYVRSQDRGGKGSERIQYNNRWYATQQMKVPCGSVVRFAVKAPSQYSRVRHLKITIENQNLEWLLYTRSK